jgi:selenocysteine lyase/cysteine desulfurase
MMAPMTIERLRSSFPITRERVYLITGAVAPLANPVRVALEDWIERAAHEPLLNFEGWGEHASAARSKFARLIGTDGANIAITDGTSRAANIAIGLLASHPNDVVLVDPTTYPSSLFPWLSKTQKQVVTIDRELNAEVIDDHAGRGICAVAISHVAWQTGHRHDLRPLADAVHRAGGVLMVDAAQSAGVSPIDVVGDGVDVLITTAMKWLFGVPGVGFLYVSPTLAELPAALDAGYLGLSISDPWSGWPSASLPPPARGAARFEVGMPALPSVMAALAGLDLILDTGVSQIAAQTNRLVDRCLDGLDRLGIRYLTPRPSDRRAGVIAARHPEAKALGEFLASKRIDVGGGNDWGLLRVDPAAFCTDDDIDAFLDATQVWLDAPAQP